MDKNIEKFLNMYCNTLLDIYKTGFRDHGPGLLIIDINNNENNKCNTQYVKGATLTNDFPDIKTKVIENTDLKKAYMCFINNDTKVFVDKDII